MFNDFIARVAPTVVGYNCVLIGKMVSNGEGIGVTSSALDYIHSFINTLLSFESIFTNIYIHLI